MPYISFYDRDPSLTKKAMMIQYLLNRIVHTWHSMKWLRQYICQMKNHGCHIGPTHETLF